MSPKPLSQPQGPPPAPGPKSPRDAGTARRRAVRQWITRPAPVYGDLFWAINSVFRSPQPRKWLTSTTPWDIVDKPPSTASTWPSDLARVFRQEEDDSSGDFSRGDVPAERHTDLRAARAPGGRRSTEWCRSARSHDVDPATFLCSTGSVAHQPDCATFAVSSDGLPLPGCDPATDETRTVEDPVPRSDNAAFSTRKLERTLTSRTGPVRD